MVEHGTENAGVDSSSLSLGTSSPFLSIGSFGFVSFARLRLAILLDKFTALYSNCQYQSGNNRNSGGRLGLGCLPFGLWASSLSNES